MYAGAMFFKQDFEDPDVFASKCANMFMFGAQLGWFSLIGRDNQAPYMGIYEELMDEKYDMEIEYLRKLSKAKRVANSYFLNGRSMRQLPL